MSMKRKIAQPQVTAEHIDGAYGLVLGVCMDRKSSEDWSNSSAGWKAWSDPRIQAAAMRAAAAFLEEIKTVK